LFRSQSGNKNLKIVLRLFMDLAGLVSFQTPKLEIDWILSIDNEQFPRLRAMTRKAKPFAVPEPKSAIKKANTPNYYK